MNALLDMPNAASLLSNLLPAASSNALEEPPASALEEYDDEDSEGGGATTSATDYSSSGRFNAGGALGSSGSKQVLVAGSQFRIITKQAGCESCLAYDAKAKRQKEAIRSLKVQISRLQEQVLSLRKGRGGDPSSASADDAGAAERLTLSLRRCEELETENRRLSNLSSADQCLVQSLREGNIKLSQEVSTLHAALAVSREECGARSSSLRDVQGLLDAARMELLQHQAALDHSEARVRLLQAREQQVGSRGAADAEEISRLRAALLDAEEAAREAGAKFDVSSLRIIALTDETDKAKAKAAEAEAACALSEQRGEESRGRAAEAEEAKRALDSLLSQERDRAGDLDRRLTEQTHATLAAYEETTQLASALNEALTRAAADRDALAGQQAALLKAMQSSIRLLIVAPSVNVTVGDVRLRLKGQLSEPGLRQVLSNEVMGKFSQVLVLPEPGAEAGAEAGASEGGASEGGAVGGEEWIQRLLHDMQRTIENHVQRAMESPASP